MNKGLLRLGAGLAFLGLASVAASAQSGSMSGPSTMAAPAATANFCGTVIALVEAGCIGVKSSMPGGPLYEITSANPKPAVGMLIVGSGTPGGVSFCQQGTHLTNVKWQKAAACPLSKAGAQK
jgi:hypothetical protein